MVALALTSGAYSAQSIIANAQRCVNLYPEGNPPETRSSSPVTHYLAAGLRLKFVLGGTGGVRGLYRATNGVLYGACGDCVYVVGEDWVPTLVGNIAPGTTQVKMADNGTDVLIVDGTPNGYTINLKTNAFSGLTAADNSGTNGFVYYGANYVDCVDTFFIGNAPGTPSWWASASNALQFDPLSYASKSGAQDNIYGVVALRRYIWLIGTTKATEIWYNAGGTNFPFAILSGPYIEHGCAAQYSIAKLDEGVFWLVQDQSGSNVVVYGEAYTVQRVSNNALEHEWNAYPKTSDAVGFTYQEGGHDFYGLRFPTADKTWVFDKTTGQWHERTTQDADGVEHQWRVTCTGFAYEANLGGDWENGNVYEITPQELTDNCVPIKRLRSWPQVVQELHRVVHWRFVADMAVGAGGGSEDNTVNLRWSDNRGATWGNPVPRSFGAGGEYSTNVLWPQTGIARGRVWELSWTSPQITALNGAFEVPVVGTS